VAHAAIVDVAEHVAAPRKQLQPSRDREPLGIAVRSEPAAADEFHGKVRVARLGPTRINEPGDAGMGEPRESAALGVEACDRLRGVEPGLDQL